MEGIESSCILLNLVLLIDMSLSYGTIVNEK